VQLRVALVVSGAAIVRNRKVAADTLARVDLSSAKSVDK